MRPEKRETDALVQVWLDRRYLATIQRLIIKYEPTPPKHLSEIIRYGIEVFVESAVEQGLVEFVDTTSEATRMLGTFSANLNPRNRGMKNLMINLQRDTGSDGFDIPQEAQSLAEDTIDALMREELRKLQEEK